MVKVAAGTVDGDNPFGRGDSPTKGKYHFCVVNCTESDPKASDKLVVDFEVLAGTVDGMEGRVHREFFATSEKAMGRILRLACALKMTTQEEIKRKQELGEDLDLDFEADAEGRQCCGEIIDDEYQGKTRQKLAFNGIWAVDAPDAKDIPKNKGLLDDWLHGGNSESGDVPFTGSGEQADGADPFAEFGS